MKQQEIWERHTSKIRVSNIIKNFKNPSIFQKEFTALINDICKENTFSTVLEAGCESGITSMLLNNNLSKYFLDLNFDILKKVEEACNLLGIIGNFINEDMLAMSCSDEYYVVVFNSGVIEHFNKQERIHILKEYSRVLKHNGLMILGVPNHFSFPYRSAYLFKKKLLKGYQWPWPEEFKIYDLKKELKAANLQLVKRTTLAKETIFNFWCFILPIRKLLIMSDKLFKYEGYLTTLIIKKA